ncbi:MAG: DNA replication/repair protein RecF [Eubacteriales bacterium]|nr:DNA replication/repair protein RecF [Eubacteriales bacterium]
MQIHSLRLQNFRNYQDQLLEAVPGDNILLGRNAQGKTNILEAIYILSSARSHRTGKDSELIRQGSDFYRLELKFSGQRGADQELLFFYQDLEKNADREIIRNISPGRRKRREIYYQGQKLERISDLFGLFQAVIFAPEDLQLIKGSPSERRRYIDLLLTKLSHHYFINLQEFQRILQERNRLLKKARGGINQFLELELEIWTEKLLSAGAKIIKERVDNLLDLEQYAAAAQAIFSDNQEKLKISYSGFQRFTAEASLEDIQEAYKLRLKRSLAEDIVKGSTSYGPQRDDLELELNGLPAKNYASQGQQRSLALALRIAELKLIAERTGEKPVLLLDDVLSELDDKRRQALFEAIQSEQVFLSCADNKQALIACTALQNQDSKEGKHRCALFEVKSGSLSPI